MRKQAFRRVFSFFRNPLDSSRCQPQAPLPLPKIQNKKTGSSSAATSSSSAFFSAHVFSVPHPRTGKDVQFLLHRSSNREEEKKKKNDDGDDDKDDDDGNKTRTSSSPSSVVSLLEASRFAPSHGSWFYAEEGRGEAVCSDPGVLLLTEVDPLFVVLPALDSARALMSERRKEGEENASAAAAGDSAAANNGGRFVDADAAVCGGERGEDSGKRAAAALALLFALAGGREIKEEGKDEENDTEMMPSSSSPPDCSPPPLSPLSPRSRARLGLLRAAGEALSSICEVKNVGGDSYFRLCERRTKTWLRLKASAAAAALKATGGPVFAGLEGEALEAAGGALIAEWLPREWSERMGWPCPGASPNSSSSRPASAAAAAAPSWAPASEKVTGTFTRDPNLPSETETFMAKEERYQEAGEFAKKVKLDAAAAAREKAKAVRQDAKALAAKKEASTMKSLAGFFVVKKKT